MSCEKVVSEHAGHKGSKGRQSLGDCFALPPSCCHAGGNDAPEIFHAAARAQVLLHCLCCCAALQSCRKRTPDYTMWTPDYTSWQTPFQPVLGCFLFGSFVFVGGMWHSNLCSACCLARYTFCMAAGVCIMGCAAEDNLLCDLSQQGCKLHSAGPVSHVF